MIHDKKVKSDRAQRFLRQIILVHHACSMKVFCMPGPCLGQLVLLRPAHWRWYTWVAMYIQFLVLRYSHTRPAERQMVTLLINMFLYWIGAFSKREPDSEGRQHPSSAHKPELCSGGYPIPAMQHKRTAEK